MSKAHIAKSTGVLAAATALSRILGFARDMVLAALFGTSASAQAFVVAFRLPNLLRDLVAEGAVTSAFVPVLSAYRATRPGEFWPLAQALLARTCLILLALGASGALAAPFIVRIIAPGFAGDPGKFALTVRLTRLLFPFITLVGLWAYAMGVLNSLGRFIAPALGPAILNIAMIIAGVGFASRVQPGVLALAWGVLIGGAVQVAIQVPAAMRAGFRWGWRWRHPGAGDVLRLLGPRTVGSAAYQLSVVVDTALASLAAVVGEGAVAALYFANRLVQLPLAVFGTASAQASLPALSAHAARRDIAEFQATLVSVLRMVGMVVLPSAAGLIVLARPIVETLFERGAFDHRATVMTAQALACYALGLLAFTVSKICSGGFYALRETRVPVRLAVESLLANVVLSVALMWPLRLNGLALAAALSNSLNAYRLLRALERRLGLPLLATVAGPWLRMAGASVLMAIGCRLTWRLLAPLSAAGALGAAIVAGLGWYAVACLMLRVQEFQKALRWLRTLPLLHRLSNE